MTLSTSQSTAYSQSNFITFTAVQIVLPNHTINLIDTAGFVRFAVNGEMTVFESSDPIYGTLGSVPTIQQSMASESPRVMISLAPPTTAAIGSLVQPEVQGSTVRIYEGVVDPANPANALGTPLQVWRGFIDVGFVNINESSQTVELDTATVLERFLMPSEGEKLTSTWQQLHFPGQNGLAWNQAATNSPNWGKEGIGGAKLSGINQISGGGGYTGGGGGNGGGGGGYDQYLVSF